MSASNISIRPAVPEDGVSVTALIRELGHQAGPRDPDPRLTRILADEDQQLFVAVLSDGKIVAWAHVFVAGRLGSPAFAEIGGLVVAESFRRCGIGSKLVGHCEQWAMEKNQVMLRVRCNSTRRDAHGFYGDLGYGRTKDQVVFDKSLGGDPGRSLRPVHGG